MGLWRQQAGRMELARQREQLKPLVEEADALAARLARQRSGPREIATNELAQLRRDHQELLRLRGELAGLRARGRLTEDDLAQRIRLAQAETEEARRETELIAARRKAADVSKETLNVLSSYAHLVVETARSSGAGFAQSWDDVGQALNRPWPPNGRRTAERMQRIQQSLRRMFKDAAAESISLAAFEFLPVPPGADPKPGTPGAVSAPAARILLLRELQPRPRPDGGWARAYAFADGNIREAISESGDFSEWETKARSE